MKKERDQNKNKIMKPLKKTTIRRLNYLDYDSNCFRSEIWDLLTPNEQKDLLLQLVQGLKDLRDLFTNLAKRIPKNERNKLKNYEKRTKPK
jgi:hypothetical protein